MKIDMRHNSGILVFLLLMTTTVASLAADVRVRVFERGGGGPLPGVAVCMGTSARIDQFGAQLTSDDGYVVFSDVPRAVLQVTASRPGYKSEQEIMVTSNVNRMLILSLATGGGGPQCPLGEAASSVQGRAIAVSRFAINEGVRATFARTVTLDYLASGHPTHYRASERSDFNGTDWQHYTASVRFQLSPGAGRKVVYFQVRRQSKTNGADLEILSPVVRSTIFLQQP